MKARVAIQIGVSTAQAALLKRRAKEGGYPLASYVREAAVRWALAEEEGRILPIGSPEPAAAK